MAFNQTVFGRQDIQVEKLQMSDLMRNPLVQGMVTEAIDNATYQKKLFKHMNALQDQLLEVKDELAMLKDELAQRGTTST